MDYRPLPPPLPSAMAFPPLPQMQMSSQVPVFEQPPQQQHQQIQDTHVPRPSPPQKSVEQPAAPLADHEKKFSDAFVSKRSLMFYAIAGTVPIIIMCVVLLWGSFERDTMLLLCGLGAIVAMMGMGRLFYELVYDIAGYPDFKLPVWSVLYLIVYSILAFAFIIFGMVVRSPNHHLGGFGFTYPDAFLDAIYLSISNYIGMAPDPTITQKSRPVRYLSVSQGIFSLFINLVIITKFVNAF